MKIEELEIYTTRLAEQKNFYREILELEILNENQISFEVRLGFSILKFVYKKNSTPYHIAIHITDKQEEKALDWLKSRGKILKAGNDEIIDFSNWNAKSVYFYDKDLNIMELISRRDFIKSESSEFSSKNLLGIAEIGLATNDLNDKFQFLKDKCKLKVYGGDCKIFCAIGDDQGLFIAIDKNSKDWFPTDDKAYSSGFKIKFQNKGKRFELQFANDELALK